MIYAMLAPLGFGVSNSLSKITGTELGPVRSIILQNFYIISTLVTLSLFTGGFSAFQSFWVFISALIGVFGYFGFTFFIRAITTGKIGVIVPIVDLVVIVSSLHAFFFLQQRISFVGILFMLLILFGAVLLSVNFKDWKDSHLFDFKSGVPFAIFASLIWGTEYFLRTFPIQHIGAINTSLIIEISVMCTALIHLIFVNKEKIFDKLNPKILKVGFLIGLFGSMGNLGVNFGISSVGGPITFAILGARPAISALVAFFVFKEKLSSKQSIAMLLVIIGVVGVSLFK